MNTVITIGRQFGSAGREIGEKVANSDLDFYTYYAANEDEVKEIAAKYAV